MPNHSNAVLSLLSEFATKIELTVRADILESLGGAKASPKFSRAIKVGGSKGAKRDPQAIEALTEVLHKYVARHPGERIEKISVGLGISTRELRLPMTKLLATKAVKTRGQKRATTYSTKA